MNLWTNFLLDTSIGASIGLVTNYLAIKMLFHPRKRRWWLPYLGVIPKEKHRLALAIGKVVEKELIRPETFAAKIRDGAVGGEFGSFISLRLRDLLTAEADRTVGEMLGPAVVDKLMTMVRSKVDDYLDSAPLRERVDREIRRYLEDSFSRRPADLMSDQLTAGVKRVILQEIDRFRIGDEMHGHLGEQIDRTIHNIVSSGRRIEDFPWLVEKIEDNEEPLVRLAVGWIIRLLQENDKVRKFLLQHIPRAIVAKFRDFKNETWYKRLVIGVLADEAEIEERIRETVQREIERMGSDEGQQRIVDTVLEFLRREVKPRGLSMTVSEVFGKVKVGKVDTFRSWVLDRLVQLIRHESVGHWIEQAVGTRVDGLLAQQVETIVERVSPRDQLLQELGDGLSSQVQTIFTEHRGFILEKVEENARGSMGAFKLGDFLAHARPEEFQALVSTVFDQARRFLADHMTQLFQSLHLADVVSGEIDRFELDRIEGIIYKVTGKELQFITWVGGILGAFIGAVQFLKNYWLLG